MKNKTFFKFLIMKSKIFITLVLENTKSSSIIKLIDIIQCENLKGTTEITINYLNYYFEKYKDYDISCKVVFSQT